MSQARPELDLGVILYLLTSLVFILAILRALFLSTREARRDLARFQGTEDGDSGRRRRRAFLEELVWIAVPALLLIWLWRAIG